MNSSRRDSDPVSYRQKFASQLAGSAGVDYVAMGFFDPASGKFTEFWLGSHGEAEVAGAVEIRDGLCRDMHALCAGPLLASKGQPDTAGREDDPLHWATTEERRVCIGTPNTKLYPVLAVPRRDLEDGGIEQTFLETGMFYLSQQLEEALAPFRALKEQIMDKTFSVLSVHCAVVDPNGTVVYITRKADNWLRKTMDFDIVSQRLVASSKRTQQHLLQALRRATSDARETSVVPLEAGEGLPRTILVTPLESVTPVRALVIFEHNQDDYALRDHLLQLSGLTLSERRVAHQILQGKSLAQTSEETKLKLSTVRSYLKRIYAKTSTHRQSELVSLYHNSRPRGRLGPLLRETRPDR